MVTVGKVQEALGITGKDERIRVLIELAEEWIKGYCNIEEIPNDYDRNIIKMVEYDLNRKAGIESESLSRHSVSFSSEYPHDIIKGLRRKLRWP